MIFPPGRCPPVSKIQAQAISVENRISKPFALLYVFIRTDVSTIAVYRKLGVLSTSVIFKYLVVVVQQCGI